MQGEHDSQSIDCTHPTSGRTAIVEVAGQALWLYLTAPDELRPVSDCWLANLGQGCRSAGPEGAPLEDKTPPPAPSSVLKDKVVFGTQPADYSLDWSDDGEAVRARIGNRSVAFVTADTKPGFNDNLSIDCPWGRRFNQARHDDLFPRN